VLKESIHRIEGIHPIDQRLILNGTDLSDDNEKYLAAIGVKSDFLSLKFSLRGGCGGGKGGFGSLLRSAKSAKKTTNYGSCRDLQGRRLRDVQNERRLAEWSEKEKGKIEFKKEEVIEEPELIENSGREKYIVEKVKVKEIINNVGDSVEKGLALVKEKELKRKREEDNNNNEIRFFGQDLSSEEDSSASDSESDNPSTEPPLKKKHSTIDSPSQTSTLSAPEKLGPPSGSKRSADSLVNA